MKKLKELWDWLLGKTTIDEAIIEVIDEVKDRAEEMADELKDVKKAIKNVVAQSKDVIGASKGKKRKGRPKKK
jgi:gas vesicle protein